MRHILILILGLAIALCGCSDDDKGESITDVCSEKCDVNKSQCIQHYNLCISKCKTVSSDADKNFITGCGLCVAKSFKYFIDSSGCHGPMNKTPTDKECMPSCFLPDGGPGY